MRWRYLIERDVGDRFYLSTVDPEGEQLAGGGSWPTVEQAKEAAEQEQPHEAVKWKPAPAAWQPDALAVSQFFIEEES